MTAAVAQREPQERRSPLIPVADIVAELNRDVRGWCNELLPGGHPSRAEYRAHDFAGGPGSAVVVGLSGRRLGRWWDYRADEGGDLLSLIARCRFGGNIKDAILFAKARLGLEGGARPAEQRPPAPRQAEARDLEEERRRRAYAVRLYLSAEPSIAGTPVESYLLGRGIDLRALGRQPRALRFHPEVRNTDHNASFPAMIAAFNDGDGGHVATHVTFLDQRGGRWVKIAPPAANPKSQPRKMYGTMRGAFCSLWRGRSCRRLRDAPADDVVAIAEGIETALSVAIACPELRVLAAGSVAGMSGVRLPEAIRTVILAADNDPDRPAAARGLRSAIAQLQFEEREVRVAMPDVPGADWNDILQGVEG